MTDDVFETGSGYYYVAITSNVDGEGYTGLYRVDDLDELNNIIPDVSDAFDPEAISLLDVPKAILQVGKNLVGSGDVSSNIKSCFWLPYKAETTDFGHRLHVGLFLTECHGHEIKTTIQNSVYSVAIPWQFNDWRNGNPYTEVYLYLPFVGVVAYSPSSIKDCERLTINLSINVLSGSIAYEVIGFNSQLSQNHILGIYTSDIAVPYPIGNSGFSSGSATIGTIGAVTSIAGAVATKNPKLLAGAVASIGAIQPLSVSAGSVGGGAVSGLDLKIHCFTITHGTKVEPSTFAGIWGYPYGRIDTIGNHSGYVMTNDFSVDAPIHEDERQMINTLMNSGVYIE